jgi:hypothetical protein
MLQSSQSVVKDLLNLLKELENRGLRIAGLCAVRLARGGDSRIAAVQGAEPGSQSIAIVESDHISMQKARAMQNVLTAPLLRRRLRLAGALALLAAAPSWAAGEDAGRFTMSPAEGGVIRLDRETGAMAFCSGTAGNWSCKDMPEAESALRKRVEELEGEKRALEAERRLRDGPQTKAPETGEPPAADAVPAPPGDLPVPTERDVDKLFDYVEGMVKKFKERIDRLEREAKKDPEVPL